MINLIERAKGCIVGSAIGDALGMPLEYINEEELNNLYGGKINEFKDPSLAHPCGHLKAGQYTDDTQQTIALAESILEKKGFDILVFAEKLKTWVSDNLEKPECNRFPGITSITGCQELLHGIDPYQSGSKISVSCGAIMRVSPVGVFYYADPQLAMMYGRMSSIPTHSSQIAIESAGFVAEVIANLMNGNDPLASCEVALSNLTNVDLHEKIDFVCRNLGMDPKQMLKCTGSSASIFETLPFALYSFLKSPCSFEDCIVRAANDSIPGDTDSIACIAGACAGAHNGYDKVPSKFKNGLENRIFLEELAERLICEADER